MSMIRRSFSSALNDCAHDPITPSEFVVQLSRIWHPQGASKKNVERTRIGLCVSGGPDSMALAYLFHQLKMHDMGPKFDLTAFIVDHANRPDSRTEALTVSNWLKDLGWIFHQAIDQGTDGTAAIKSRVLETEWPPGQDPARITNFESIARVLRYQNFAHGCLQEDIRSLFLGHHSTDLAETIMYRLVRGQGFASAGLVGIKPVNSIPCCESIYGASCGPDALSLSDLLGSRSTPPWAARNRGGQLKSSPVAGDYLFAGDIPVSQAGIKVYRPLLQFPKSRLVATCAVNGIPFVNDPSNFDPKVTVRNAIRWLLSSKKVPRALQTDSLLHLGVASARLNEVRKKKVEDLMKATRLVHFDIRSSRLRVVVPEDIVSRYKASELDAGYYISRLLSSISPTRETPRSFLHSVNTAGKIFPELHHAGESALDKPMDFRSFTSGDVWLGRLLDTTFRMWELRRRPFVADENPESTFSPAPSYSRDTDRDWSGWSVWDGRYWIRIRLYDPKDVTLFKVRALQPSDMEKLRAGEFFLPPRLRKKLKNSFRDAAPGKSRFTLPVLVKGKEVRALPTFDIGFPSMDTMQRFGGNQGVTDGLRWEVRYKNITEMLQLWKKSANDEKETPKLDSWPKYTPEFTQDHRL